MEEIRIKCPNCGKVLKVKNMPGIEAKLIKCPVCQHQNPFTSFMNVMEKPAEQTQYRTDQTNGSTSYKSDQINLLSGQLVRMDNPSVKYNLKKGVNIVGRKAVSSTADIQIDTYPSKRLSRTHLRVEAKMVTGRGMVHYVSLCKNETNDTMINSSPIRFGDELILKNGDTLSLPDVKLKFVIPDEDGTTY